MSMKKIFCFAIGLGVVVICACSPKNASAVASTVPAPKSDISTAQVDAAKTKYPDAALDALQKGHDIYFGGPCTLCHGPKTITDFSPEELPGIIDHMARKAKISDEEKSAVVKYVMGVRLAAK